MFILLATDYAKMMKLYMTCFLESVAEGKKNYALLILMCVIVLAVQAIPKILAYCDESHEWFLVPSRRHCWQLDKHIIVLDSSDG